MDATHLKAKQKCIDCNEVCEVTEVNLEYMKTFKTDEGETLLLSYYECPACGSRNFVQVDNGDTLQTLKGIKKMFLKFAAKKAKHQNIPGTQRKKFEKEQKDLASSRMELTKKYTGARVTDMETEQVYELRFRNV